MRVEIAHLLQQLDDARGTEIDALHKFRSLALDITGNPCPLLCRFPTQPLRVIPHTVMVFKRIPRLYSYFSLVGS